VMPDGETRLARNILKNDGACLHEAARGDGAVETVENGLLWPGVRDSPAGRGSLLSGSENDGWRKAG
jgi:hypothetical protein